MLSSLLAGTSLPLERVTAQKFRAGQIISDRPSGVLSVGLIVSGRVEVYSVALEGCPAQHPDCGGVFRRLQSAGRH